MVQISFQVVDYDADPVHVHSITFDGVAQADQEFAAGSSDQAIITSLCTTAATSDPGAPVRRIGRIDPLTYNSYRSGEGGTLGHDVVVIPLLDPTDGAVVEATINDDGDYDSLSFEFDLPQDFDGWVTTPLSVEVKSSAFANTDLEVSLVVSGAADATIVNLDINPSASAEWQTKTSVAGTVLTSADAGKKTYIKLKFLGNAANMLRLRELHLDYWRRA